MGYSACEFRRRTSWRRPMNDPDWMAKNRRASYNMMPRVENWTAAYKLSQEEARDIAVTYVLNNYLTLEKPVTFGKDGSPSYPKIGERAKLKIDNIGGVAFVPDDMAANVGRTMTGPDGPAHGGACRPPRNISAAAKQMGCLDDLLGWNGRRPRRQRPPRQGLCDRFPWRGDALRQVRRRGRLGGPADHASRCARKPRYGR